MKIAPLIACPIILLLCAHPPLRGGDAPEIAFDELEYDFGKVAQGENVVHTFPFRNRGGGDLRIERVKTSCGCTVPTWPREPIPAGESGAIKATFSTNGRRGRQRKTISVTSNDMKNSLVTLTISGEIVVPLTLDPPRLSLRDVVFGDGASATVRVSLAPDWKQCRITDVTSTSPYIEGRVEDAKLPKKKGGLWMPFRGKAERKEYRETDLHVSVKREAPRGRVHGRLILKYEGEKKGEAMLPVYVRVVGNITASPERLSLGAISPEAGKEASVVVSDRRGGSPDIKGIETGSDFIEVERRPIDACSTRLLVRVRPGAPKGFLRGVLKVQTDDPAERMIEIPYSGHVRPEAVKTK